MKIKRQQFNYLIYWLISTIVFLIVLLVINQLSFKNQVSTQLNKHLSPELTKAFQQHIIDKNYKNLVKSNLNQQLALTNALTHFNIFKRYSLTIEALFSESDHSNLHTIYVPWQFGLEAKQAKVILDYQIRWWLIICICSISTFIILVLIHLVPKPVSSHYKQWLNLLKSLQVEDDIAKALSDKIEITDTSKKDWLKSLLTKILEDNQLTENVNINDLVIWFLNKTTDDLQQISQIKFIDALYQSTINIDQAYQLAKKTCVLSFNIDTFTININNFEIKLAKTPFFYYLWYAYLKVNNVDAGWLINPSINHPDTQSANTITTLMKENHGHSKSINELETHGLRAKTLDQNRNKIKETLISQLGEELSQPYLFDLLRDTKTGRFKYRLKLDAESIKLPQAIKNTLTQK
ncbi:hypothetical protein [Thalassotalea profundi]|uniref:LapD/MoxY periplasmic domain-containing protein n=1 Tax=Thalassotalea profundi TaxID=2036687 RepID=A0ABQ3IXJ5_9GAMM|nr:hypothetical protein [Thalassotalea profundi]GHE95961.1 hypothetical protein GCM10011501_26960 [Thalassotalea profundi]